MSHVGEGIRRTEDPRLLRGLGEYVGDITLPNLLHAGFIRSPYARAHILDVDLADVRQLPGVVAAYSAADLPELSGTTPTAAWQAGGNARGFVPLAAGEVRFAGEAVAVVVATEQALLEDAVNLSAVRYTPLSPVSDVEAALSRPERVWEDLPSNIAGTIDTGFGDVEAGFQKADVIVQERFSLARSAPAAMEPRAVLAAPGDADGVAITVWDSTQAPHNVRDSLAQYFGLDPQAVRVITPDVGGGFGPKGRVYPEEYVVAALALRLGRPVRWMATRQEDLMTTAHGRGQNHDARLALRCDGTILALRDHFTQDLGAYAPMGLGAASNTTRHLLGPYRVPAAEIRATGVYTNRVMTSPLRGGGRPEGIFVMERLLDRAAAQLGLDRAEIRRRNLLSPDIFPYDTHLPSPRGGAVVYDSGDYPRYLEQALALIGYDRFESEREAALERNHYLGLGIACFIESTGGGAEGARIEIDEGGLVSVAVGSPSNGQGHATTFAQIAADRLGVRLDAIRVHSGDTGAYPWGTGTFASRMGQSGGNAVRLAALAVREQLLALAADMLEISAADLELASGEVAVKGVPTRRLSLAQIAGEAARRDIQLVADEAFAPEHQSTWAGGTNAAIVEVDVETGRVAILRYVVVHDAGTLVNPKIVEGQIHGGVAHGIGNALYEVCAYEGGQLLTSTFADYTVPAVGDVPDIRVTHVESPSPFNPEGIKGAGEGGTIAAIPTIASAVEDALRSFGIVLRDVPIRLDEKLTIANGQ